MATTSPAPLPAASHWVSFGEYSSRLPPVPRSTIFTPGWLAMYSW